MTPYAAMVALLAGVAAAEWSTSCLKLSGNITITDEAGNEEPVLPEAKICAYCDNTNSHPLILNWDTKSLVLYVMEDSSKTFYLDQIDYYDGSSSWHTSLSGIRGNRGGTVTCSSVSSAMQLDKEAKSYSCPSSQDQLASNATSHGAAERRHRVRAAAGQERSFSATGLSIQYARDDGSTEDVSGCRATADLTMVSAISGAITAGALLAAAFAAAPRLLC